MIIIGLGLALIVLGLFLPTRLLIPPTSSADAILQSQRTQGALIFKLGLVAIGLALMWMNRLGDPSGHRQIEPAEQQAASTWLWIGLAAIIAIATILRLLYLNEDLWFDEIVTFVKFAHMSTIENLTTYDSQGQHFLYSILAHISFAIFGEHNWSLRLPAVLFGIGSILMTFQLGKEVGHPSEALLAAGLLTFAYHHIWFSQNARGYTGLLFWTLLSSWALIRGQRTDQPRYWLLYAFTAALGVFTHLTMVFVLLGQGVITLWTQFVSRDPRYKVRWSNLLLGFGFGGLLTLQLHALVLPQMLSGLAGEGGGIATWRNPLWTINEFIQGFQVGFSAFALAGLGGLVVVLVGLIGYLRENPYITPLFVLPTAIGALTTIAMGHHLWPRFFFFALGFAVLILMRGIVLTVRWGASLLRMSEPRATQLGYVLCGAAILVSAASVPAVYGPKQDFSGALEYLETTARPGEPIVAVGLARFPYTAYFGKTWVEVEDVETLNTIRNHHPRTWLVYTLPIQLEAIYPEIMTSIENDFQIMAEYPGTLRGGTVYVCLAGEPPAEDVAGYQ